MGYTVEQRRHWLILQCRYYNGEENVPNTLPSTHSSLWFYEKKWVEFNVENDYMLKIIEQDIKAFNLATKEGDKTPLTLKGLLMNRYLHWSGYAPIEYELKAFEDWYAKFYLVWKTNREKRADKRRLEFISKCKCYRGENCCPYNDFDKIQIWTWEKEWVDALSFSYRNRQRFLNELMHTPCLESKPLNYWKNRAHKLRIAESLLACIGKNFGHSCCGFKHEIEDYFDLFLLGYKELK